MLCDSNVRLKKLAALTPKIKASSAKLNAQAMGNALYGLQGMDTGSQVVQALLQELSTKITKCDRDGDNWPFYMQAVSGLIKMSFQQNILNALVKSIIFKLMSELGSNLNLDLPTIVEHHVSELKAKLLNNNVPLSILQEACERQGLSLSPTENAGRFKVQYSST